MILAMLQSHCFPTLDLGSLGQIQLQSLLQTVDGQYPNDKEGGKPYFTCMRKRTCSQA